MKSDILCMNQLIADFMGIECKEDFYVNDYKSLEYKRDCQFIEYAQDLSELSFHYDWSYLMPVVERIESMGYHVRLDSAFTAITKGSEEIAEYGANRAETTCNAIVKFIISQRVNLKSKL
jgi:3-methyladenine DNA glycosylase/8-oxoguanine DNA glycosylase